MIDQPLNISYKDYLDLEKRPRSKIEIIEQIKKGKIYFVNRDSISYALLVDGKNNLLLKDE
jgi:hypothetical protein